MAVGTGRPVRRVNGTLPAALAGMCVVLALVGITFGVRVERSKSDIHARYAALEVARQAATYLTTVNYGEYQQNADRVLDLSVGEFADSYQAQMKQVETLVMRSKTVSQGVVVEAGVVRAAGDRARVLVAADSSSTDSSTGGFELRQYRMQIDLVRTDGRWLVSDVEFVS